MSNAKGRAKRQALTSPKRLVSGTRSMTPTPPHTPYTLDSCRWDTCRTGTTRASVAAGAPSAATRPAPARPMPRRRACQTRIRVRILHASRISGTDTHIPTRSVPASGQYQFCVRQHASYRVLLSDKHDELMTRCSLPTRSNIIHYRVNASHVLKPSRHRITISHTSLPSNSNTCVVHEIMNVFCSWAHHFNPTHFT